MINFSEFTVGNGALTDLRELLFLTLYRDPDIAKLLSIKTGVKNGDVLDYVNDLGDVGLNASGCNPTYTSVNITGIEKKWSLGPWQIAKHVCYTELENTLGQLDLNPGTDIAYLENTPYWDLLIRLLKQAIVEMFWRIVFFGDKDAKNIADGGILKAGVDKKLFTMCDGLWKRFKAIIAENAHQQTTVTANVDKGTGTAITYQSQKEAVRKEGYAIKLVDTLLSDADSRIFDLPDASIYMTSSLFKALRSDVVAHYTKATMPWEKVSAGVHVSEYDGVRIVVLDIWDRLIKKFEDTGTALNNPHRAIVTAPGNLFVGTDDKSHIATLRTSFNDETQYNNIFATAKIDTLVGEDALVQVAI